jgi:hypothetical protein
LVLVTYPKDQLERQKMMQDAEEAARDSQNALDADQVDMEGMEGMDGSQKDPGMDEDGSAVGADGQKLDPIDWDKVGKIYKPESAIEDIVAREMGRLQNALDQKIDIQ